MQYETIIYGKVILPGERVVDLTYLTKLRHGSNWYAETDITNVFIPLSIIIHQKLKLFVTSCVDY